MRTLLRWLGLVLSLIVARVLIAAAILAAVIFLIGQGMQSLGLQPPTQQDIVQRLQPALHELQPLIDRIQRATNPPAATDSTPTAAPEPEPTQP